MLSADFLILYQRGDAHLLREEVVAVLQTERVERPDGDRVQRSRYAALHGAVTAVRSGIVLRPAAALVEGSVVKDCARRDDARVQRGRVDGDGLDGRTGRQLALRRAVQGEALRFLADAAGHGDDVAGRVVDQHDGGLELLRTDGIRHVVRILIDAVDDLLRGGVDRGVDAVAAGEQLLHGGKLAQIVLLAQIVHDVAVDGVDEIGIGVVVVHGVVLRAAVRAVVGAVQFGILAARAVEAAGGAVVGLFIVAPVVEEHFLCLGGAVLRVGQVALRMHFAEDDELTVAVALGIDIRIVEGRIVRDGDDRSTFGRGELARVLAEVDFRRALHAVAALAEVDRVEVPFHDLFLGIVFLHRHGAEDLLHLAVDGDVVVVRKVLDELLRDGGRAVGGIAADEVAHRGEGADPVDAVVLHEALVFNGDRRVYEVLRNVGVAEPDAVLRGIELLQLAILAGLAVLIVDDRGLRERDVVEREVFRVLVGLRDDVGLQVAGELRQEDRAGDHADDRGRHRDDHRDQQHLSENIKDDPADPPGNIRFFCGFTGMFRHSYPSLPEIFICLAGTCPRLRFFGHTNPFYLSI